MTEIIESKSIAALTPTICSLMGLAFPRQCGSDPITRITGAVGTGLITKCVVFCPDAIGKNIFDRYPEFQDRVLETAPLLVKTRAEFPSVTPVCFASMFTGAAPAFHGIQKYEKPVVAIETLFDMAVRHGQKTAIVAVKNSSIDLIFRGRDLDYYSEAYDTEVGERAVNLITQAEHELIVVYVQAHDDNLHKAHPYAEAAINAVVDNIALFEKLAAACRENWAANNYALVFAPDHGSHFDPAKNKGVHGSDCAADMEVCHFYQLSICKSGLNAKPE